ncbi:MAG: YadA-like family protein, partial [Lonepinella koalarum]|nr:YadA-like family protein [Lonepinella koalarum]
VISNVAPGVAGTDAVNVNQLKQVANNVNQNFNVVNNRINKLDKKIDGVAANAAAAASLPQVYIPGKSMVSAAGGTSGSATSVAVGYSRASDNGKVIIKLNGSVNSQGRVSAGAGIGYQW